MKQAFGRQFIERFFLKSSTESPQLTRFTGKGG